MNIVWHFMSLKSTTDFTLSGSCARSYFKNTLSEVIGLNICCQSCQNASARSHRDFGQSKELDQLFLQELSQGVNHHSSPGDESLRTRIPETADVLLRGCHRDLTGKDTKCSCAGTTLAGLLNWCVGASSFFSVATLVSFLLSSLGLPSSMSIASARTFASYHDLRLWQQHSVVTSMEAFLVKAESWSL